MTARQASWRLALLLLIVGVGVVVAVTVGLPSVTQLREGFARFGPWAAVVFVLGYAVATLSPLNRPGFGRRSVIPGLPGWLSDSVLGREVRQL